MVSARGNTSSGLKVHLMRLCRTVESKQNLIGLSARVIGECFPSFLFLSTGCLRKLFMRFQVN